MGRPLRILLVSASAPPMQCGVGEYTIKLADALGALDGVQVGLLTGRHPDRTPGTRGAPRFEWIEPINHWGATGFWAAHRSVRRWRPDVLHVQFPAQGYDGPLHMLLALWFRCWRRQPVVVTLHGHIPPGAHATLMLARCAHAIVSVRPDFTEGFERGLSRTAAKKPFQFIPNASSIPRVQASAELQRAVRQRYGVAPGKALVAYFGLLYPNRGADRLFRIADPARHHLLIIGAELPPARAYAESIRALAQSPRWAGSATITGYLNEVDAAGALACADAIVLPFVHGGGVWNTSIHAARVQEVFTLATSTTQQGYDPLRNTYWAPPDAIEEMTAALDAHLGVRVPGSAQDVPTWPAISAVHRMLYERLIG